MQIASSNPGNAYVYSLGGVIVLALSALYAHPVRADAVDTFNIVAGVSVTHDDNLFRLAPGVNPQTVLGTSTKADDITTSSVTLKLNKLYSLQRFELEVSYIDNRYKTFSYLSYDTTPYKAAWHWALTPYLHGKLSTASVTTLNDFNDFSGFNRRNTRTEENTRLDGVFDVSPSWQLLAGVSEATTTNTEITRGQGDNRFKSAEVGIRRSFPSGNTLSYIARNGSGDYFKRPQPIPFILLDNHFNDFENELRLTWGLTGKTTIDARLAYLKREHANFASRDYSGVVGRLNLSWSISAKSFLTASIGRDFASYQTLDTNYTASNNVTLSPAWQINARTALRANYSYAQVDYLGAPIAAFISASNRKDAIRNASISLDWQPLRTMTVSATLQNEKRDSNQPGLDNESNRYGLSAQINF